MINRNSSTNFERILAGMLTVISGSILFFLAIQGPLCLNHLIYKANPLVINQILGQDLANLIMGPLTVVGGLLLLANKKAAHRILFLLPIYLIYYALSFGIGFEWGEKALVGNNVEYAFYFIFLVIAGVILLFYCFSVQSLPIQATFKPKGLLIYSIAFVVFLSLFASMWIKEVYQVVNGQELLGYTTSPTLFWVIRFFDLGFSVPLGYLSVYLLWTRPQTTYLIQMLFYGFFLSMILTVNAMAVVMFVKSDPQFTPAIAAVFGSLLVIVVSGYFYVNMNYKTILSNK